MAKTAMDLGELGLPRSNCGDARTWSEGRCHVLVRDGLLRHSPLRRIRFRRLVCRRPRGWDWRRYSLHRAGRARLSFAAAGLVAASFRFHSPNHVALLDTGSLNAQKKT
eukprot:scaffold7335_cov289-Pinguiococcus_pyrenoidosus.AAC.1